MPFFYLPRFHRFPLFLPSFILPVLQFQGNIFNILHLYPIRDQPLLIDMFLSKICSRSKRVKRHLTCPPIMVSYSTVEICWTVMKKERFVHRASGTFIISLKKQRHTNDFHSVPQPVLCVSWGLIREEPELEPHKHERKIFFMLNKPTDVGTVRSWQVLECFIRPAAWKPCSVIFFFFLTVSFFCPLEGGVCIWLFEG